MHFSTAIMGAQLSALALATPLSLATPMPAPVNSSEVPVVKNPDSIANNKEIISSLILAPTVKDRINLITNDADFVFDFNNPPPNAITRGNGGFTSRADRETFPALIGTGSSMVIGFLGPCGFNTPHTHPRSTELNLIIKGDLVTQFMQENGARTVTNRITTNQLVVFPLGALHTEYNPGCENATFVAGFASEDPGVQQTAQTFFGLSEDIVKATLGGVDTFDGADLEKLRTIIPANVAAGVEQCLSKCSISKK